MRIAVDLQALQVDGFADRGIGRYVAGLAPALADAGRLAAGLLSPELQPPSGLPAALAMSGLVRYDGASALHELLGAHQPLAHLVPAPFLFCGPTDPSVLVPAPHWAEAGPPRVALLHDLIPLRAPRRYLPSPAHLERYRARAEWVASADLVVTNSEYTRAEAIELLGRDPDRTVVVGAGVSAYFSPADGTDEEHFRFHLGGLGDAPFVLAIGGNDIRKGTERLVAAMGRLRRGGSAVHLVVVGELSDDWRARLAEAARASGLGERLHLPGAVGDELLRACYRRATLSVMPSLAEGFGLPVLESAACGTPALVAGGSALAEVAATPLACFDPADTDSLAGTMADVLADAGRRDRILDAQRLAASGSTWAFVAARLGHAVDLLTDVLPASAWATTRRRRMALVGPLPPMAGAIGLFNTSVLAAMSAHMDVDAVSPLPSAPGLPPGVRHVPADAFGPDARPASYDAVVYTLGNSDGHLATVELALRHPGWLWLHEVRLPAVAVAAIDRRRGDGGGHGGGDDDFTFQMERLLRRAYPGRAPLRAARAAGRSVQDLATGGVGLVSLLAERCRGIIVNSQAARHLLELDLPPGAHRPPVHVLPHPCPPVDPVDGEGAAGDLVVALGIVSSAKRPDVLVDAVAVAGCRVAFVGPCPPVLAEFIGDRAAARGIADRVTVAGSVDAGQWRQWLGRAALCVQLRESLAGETSGAALEAFAAGVPVLTNMVTVAEYPAGTSTFVPSLDPHVLGSAIRGVLDDPDGRRRQVEAALAVAAANQFDQLAGTLASLLAE